MAATIRERLGRLIQRVEVSALLLNSYPIQWLLVRLIWLLLLVAILALAVIAPLMDSSNPHHGLKAGWEWVIPIVSVVCLVVSCVIRRVATNPSSWAYRIFGFNYMLYMYWMIAVVSLLFSIGIFGLVIFYLEGDYFWLFLLVGISAAALILLRPRKQDLINLVIHSRRDS